MNVYLTIKNEILLIPRISLHERHWLLVVALDDVRELTRDAYEIVSFE